MDSLISIIVPIYKVEKYLPRCIESILSQTYRNIEIILVDDGSPDSCPKICDVYAEKDSRIQVIHKKNGGLSDARNAGIEVAKGEFLCFVDSDDYIQSTMIECLVTAIERTGAKLAIANVKTVDEQGKRIYSVEQSPIRNGVLTAEELLPKLYQGLGWYYIVAWNKLYHHSLFEKIRFPIGKIREDEYIIAQIVWDAQTIVCVDNEEYIYTFQRKGSIMASQQVKSHCDWLEALYLRFEFCKEEKSLAEFAIETRAVYFRELNNLFLKQELFEKATEKQRIKVKRQYASMEGKTRTERVNWLLFQINPKLGNKIRQKVRKMLG